MVTSPKAPVAWRTIRAGFLLAGLCLDWAGTGVLARQQEAADRLLAEGQAAILGRNYSKAIQLMNAALKQFPDDNRLRVELGSAYLHRGDTGRAIELFREVLRRESGNRRAKLELARALGYRRDYEASNRLYRDLLTVDADDEAAVTGLASNLLHQKRRDEAHRVVEEGLARHPNSLLLQEYKDRLEKGQLGGEEPEPVRRENRVQGEADYVSDSAGNHSLRASQQFDHRITRSISNGLDFEERWLRHTGRPAADVAAGTDQVQLRLTDFLTLRGGGGGVRFADGSGRTLYVAALDVQPIKRMWLEANFSRTPFYPDAHTAQYDLTREGWLAAFEWQPAPWRMSAWWTKQHYSDGNVERRGSAEVLRWFGPSQLAFGTGYRYTHYDFKQDLNHGYFSPDEYQSHLGLAGVQFRVGRAFHAEYVARIGAESLARGSPYQFAWELSIRNRAQWGNWELGLDYFYFRLAQNTGAFRAQAGRLAAAYRF